ncbi:MAG TPA: CorA family divalent cation transporter [Oscillospiraceae bacterium]|nr:magnesium transporter [Oscillospiraceae bacterium]HNW03798.1 CorA family divalent cation transporter [Oscillospiraceae bacterium]
MITIYKTDSEGKLKDYLGDELYARQRSANHIFLPVGERACFLAFNWCDLKDTGRREERISIYCGERELVYVGDSEVCTRILEEIAEAEPFGALAKFFSEMTAGDVDVLEGFENSINELERQIIGKKGPVGGTSARIIQLRRSFSRIKRYYEQLGFMVDGLIENEGSLLTPEIAERFDALRKRLGYLTNSILELREYVTQAREAYQASIDIEQNQTMKLLTIVTAVFLPLTLIVGWYGMNFQVPEYGWRYGYLYVILLSAAMVVFCLYILKKKKWF